MKTVLTSVPEYRSLDWYNHLRDEVRLCQSELKAGDPRRLSLQHRRYVYLMRADNGDYKIGESARPQVRRREIQRQESRRIHLVTRYLTVVSPLLERALHRHFRHYRVRGEWFNLPDKWVEPVAFCAMASILEDHVLALEEWRLCEIIASLERTEKRNGQEDVNGTQLNIFDTTEYPRD